MERYSNRDGVAVTGLLTGQNDDLQCVAKDSSGKNTQGREVTSVFCAPTKDAGNTFVSTF